MILQGLLLAGLWILAFGSFTAVAMALDTPGTDSWFDRWIVHPLLLLWIFGGAFLVFSHFAFGWFS